MHVQVIKDLGGACEGAVFKPSETSSSCPAGTEVFKWGDGELCCFERSVSDLAASGLSSEPRRLSRDLSA